MSDSIAAFLETVTAEFTQVIDTMDIPALMKAADLISASQADGARVHLTGIGKPGYVAKYLSSLLSSTGTPAYFLDGTEAVHGSSGQVCPGDVVIAISNSGETQELKATVSTLLANKAHVIACTRSESSWLAAQAEVTLVAGVAQEGDDLNKPPRASILAETVVLQALSIELQKRHALNKQDYVKWHPGGSLGASIRQEEKQ